MFLHGFVTTPQFTDWPSQPSAEHRIEFGDQIASVIDGSTNPSWRVLYYLTDELRKLPTDPSLLLMRVDLDLQIGSELDPQAHWYPGFWLAQYVADGIAEAWVQRGHGQLDELDFLFSYQDDGPNQTFFTLCLEVRNKKVLEEWIRRSGLNEEERECLE